MENMAQNVVMIIKTLKTHGKSYLCRNSDLNLWKVENEAKGMETMEMRTNVKNVVQDERL